MRHRVLGPEDTIGDVVEDPGDWTDVLKSDKVLSIFTLVLPLKLKIINDYQPFGHTEAEQVQKLFIFTDSFQKLITVAAILGEDFGSILVSDILKQNQ